MARRCAHHHFTPCTRRQPRTYNDGVLWTVRDPRRSTLPMSSSGPVTHWIGRLKAGEHAAAQALWERYFQRLVGLARKILQGQPRRAADEEDVALSAFASFCRGAEGGRFPQLGDRDDLWQILVVLTARKAYRQMTYESAQKRGGGQQPETLGPGTEATEDSGVEQILSRE